MDDVEEEMTRLMIMSAMAAANNTTDYGHSFVISSASPTDDDWDGNIVISDMEEPNREEGG